jgi:pimeloyl-ACP methyl ester carboxylesterase
MQIAERRVRANDVDFTYLEADRSDGRGPLAVCLHGFPDSPWTWRYLLPALAHAGYRAVAPFLRGYAPTSVPADGMYQSGALAADAAALHEELGGDGDAVLVGHDWGAVATYPAIAHSPERWRCAVTMAVPPPSALATGFLQYAQLKRSWYMFFFQHALSDIVVGLDDLAFIDGLWADWSPGYDASDDLPHVKDALRDPANLAAALGYYRATLGDGPKSPAYDAIEAAGAQLPDGVPLLYLHGRTDGCMGADLAEAAGAMVAPPSHAAIVDDAGHFLHLEQPDEVGRLVLEFLAA